MNQEIDSILCVSWACYTDVRLFVKGRLIHHFKWDICLHKLHNKLEGITNKNLFLLYFFLCDIKFKDMCAEYIKVSNTSFFFCSENVPKTFSGFFFEGRNQKKKMMFVSIVYNVMKKKWRCKGGVFT